MTEQSGLGGNNSNGQVGDGTTTSRENPKHLSISNIVAISAGTSFSLALDSAGNVYAWGLNSSHQLGDGTTTQQKSPEKLTTLSKITAISAGATHSLAIDVNGSVWAWGDNSSGELGFGTTSAYSTPQMISSSTLSGYHRFRSQQPLWFIVEQRGITLCLGK